MSNRREFLVLIGPPGSGKSTWAKTQTTCVIISRDFFIEEEAKRLNISYQEAFQRVSQSDVNKKLDSALNLAFQGDKNVILDMTNMSVKSRKSKLSKVPSSFTKKALVWVLSDQELRRRLLQREQETGKSVPWYVIKKMQNSYERPLEKEGFEFIEEIRE